MDWKLKQHREKQYESLKKQGIAPIFCSLISNRDLPWVKTKRDIGLLIQCPIDMLEKPSSLENMEQASSLFIEIADKDAVIFGDYDADGILSSFICEKLLLNLGANSVDVFLPSRIDDGYGLNETSVANFIKICTKQYSLVIILDCGSSSRKQIDKIKAHMPKANVVVIDHHIINESEFSSNADFVINPRTNGATPYCAAGLIYQMVRQCALSKNIQHLNYIPYAAIATIADVCPITGSNRILVKNGLDALKFCQDPGINALFEVAELDTTKCTTEDISYKIGPMINASGRIKVATKALQLLRKKNAKEVTELAKLLKTLNEERKKIQKVMAEEAIEMFEKERGERNCALLYKETWNPSIVGIVASKVAEKHNIPVICFGNQDGIIKGSARSVDNINVKEVMDRCSKIFLKYGGHEMAAGATLKPDMLNVAWNEFSLAVEDYKQDKSVGIPVTEYDYEVDADLLLRIDENFCDKLSMLEPYGPGNEMPVLRANNLYCRQVKEWKTGTGAFVQFDNTSLGCFGFGKLKEIEDKKIDILFCLSRSFIFGSKWQIKLVDYHIN